MTPGRRPRRGMAIAAVIVLVLLAAAVALAAMFGPGGGHSASRPADLTSAKANGEELLASRDKTVLVVLAHPDDAEWWSGGTLTQLARSGNRVVLVLGTSGDKAAGGWKGVAELREQLQLQAAKLIGYSDVVFLRHPDQGLGAAKAFPDEVRTLYRERRPDIVVTFDVADEGSVYHHPDHEAAGRVAWAQAEGLPSMTFYLQHTSAPDTVVECIGVRDVKQAALSILIDYQPPGSPQRWIVERARSWGWMRAAFGQGVSYPEAGIVSGEVFRKARR
jgi:LmbE family N-acetylglucosaminyl deacetylase